MSEVFVIRNQNGHYWAKAKHWVDGSDPRQVKRVRHRDEAVNGLVELSARDVNLRGEVLETSLDDRGQPVIEASQIPLPGVNEEAAEPLTGEPEAAD